MPVVESSVVEFPAQEHHCQSPSKRDAGCSPRPPSFPLAELKQVDHHANQPTTINNAAVTPKGRQSSNEPCNSPKHGESGNVSKSVKYGIEGAAIEEETPLPIPETHHVFLFINPRSGNCHGRILLEELDLQVIQLRTLPHVIIHVNNFLDKDDITGAIQHINALLRLNNGKRKNNPININVWSAGGDGTLMSVVQLLVDAHVPLTDLMFAVIPFGTGNDLSQVLGWGKTIEREQLKDIKRFGDLVKERITGEVTGFDIFEVTITTHEGGRIRKFTSSGFSQATNVLNTHMGNYSSVGVQGWVGGDFEHSRTGHRVCNMAMYAWQSARWLVKGFDTISHIDRIESAGEVVAVGKSSQAAKVAKQRGEKNIPIVAAEPIEIVIQNIPGIWGRAIDLWDNAETGIGVINGQGPTDEKNWKQQRCDDQLLEVYCINSLTSYAAKQVLESARKHLTRIGQFKLPLTFHFSKLKHGHETCMLIDGEFFHIKNIRSLTYTYKRTIKMAKGIQAKIDKSDNDNKDINDGHNQSHDHSSSHEKQQI